MCQTVSFGINGREGPGFSKALGKFIKCGPLENSKYTKTTKTSQCCRNSGVVPKLFCPFRQILNILKLLKRVTVVRDSGAAPKLFTSTVY